jgi:hypothetical protein
MPFQISPGVNVSEIDLTTIVPAVSSTEGAFAGVFRWGPIEERVLISSEDELVNQYGKPTANNFETFFTAANFLAYGNQLYISRAASDTTYNAVANTGISAPNNATSLPTGVLLDVTASAAASNSSVNVNVYTFGVQVKNHTLFDNQTFNANTPFVAKYAGALGNSLKISICPSSNAFSANIDSYAGSNSSILNYSNANTGFTLAVGSSTANIYFGYSANSFTANLMAADMKTRISVGDVLFVGNTVTGTQYMKITSIGNTVSTYIANGTVNSSNSWFNVTFDDVFKQRDSYTVEQPTTSSTTLFTKQWEYFNSVDKAPGISNYVANRTSNTNIQDEVHVVITDEDGAFTGTVGQILEVWPNLSRATDAKGEQGGSIYYKDVINQSSQYVWVTQDYLGSSDTKENFPASNITSNKIISFGYGSDGDDCNTISVSKLALAYDKFKSAEDIDISLILVGKARGGSGEVLANYIIDNICEYRKDCVAFVSPPQSATVNNPTHELQNVIDYRNLLRSTSYAVLDSGYKYQYDKYNDVYRWVPMNGDTAGLCVRTDNIRDPWFSPAGFNRGQIKNVVKLAFNPDKADRDQLYKNGINPVVNFPGQGVILYGDKTLLAKPSAFDRINVRRLFIVLEKAIATASKFTLFEFNDEFTRASFRNLVEPYLRDVQGRRGIYDFRVVCDDTNNTPEVIDRNEFRGDIYIKPARSINFIQLNFVAVRTGVEFEEIVGRF